MTKRDELMNDDGTELEINQQASDDAQIDAINTGLAEVRTGDADLITEDDLPSEDEEDRMGLERGAQRDSQRGS
jgi:hypothetical protein